MYGTCIKIKRCHGNIKMDLKNRLGESYFVGFLQNNKLKNKKNEIKERK